MESDARSFQARLKRQIAGTMNAPVTLALRYNCLYKTCLSSLFQESLGISQNSG